MQLMGSTATAADIDELLGTVTQPKPPKPATPPVPEFGGEAAAAPEPGEADAEAAAAAAAARPPPTATLAQFRRAIAGFESRHAAAARECLTMGETAEAHSHSQAANPNPNLNPNPNPKPKPNPNPNPKPSPSPNPGPNPSPNPNHSQAALRVSATLLAASEPPIEISSSKSVRLHPRRPRMHACTCT